MPARILIADDNSSVRAAMREVLQVAGEWEVIEAENGEQAVERARECNPRLIILDLVMPAKDGLTASREIIRMLPGTPILMHTLYSSPQIQIEAAKMGVRKVVPKSEAVALVSAVQEVLGADAGIPKTPVQDSEPDEEEARERTEDRIRELCTRVIATDDNAALETMLSDLRECLHRHVESFRARLVKYPVLSERRTRKTPL
jgi:two-component system, chemotaxis family, chemotaxis protein CheY